MMRMVVEMFDELKLGEMSWVGSCVERSFEVSCFEVLFIVV